MDHNCDTSDGQLAIMFRLILSFFFFAPPQPSLSYLILFFLLIFFTSIIVLFKDYEAVHVRSHEFKSDTGTFVQC